MIAKVGFPSNDELAELVPRACIDSIFNADQTKLPNNSNSLASSSLPTPPSTRPHSPAQAKKSHLRNASESEFVSQLTKSVPKSTGSSMSRFSAHNPFFGYPVITDALHYIPSCIRASFSDSLSSLPGYISSMRHPPATASVPTLRHGRRRKRDLVRTLLIMYWQRWKDRAMVFSVLMLVLNLVVRTLRGSRQPIAKDVWMWMTSHKLLTRGLTVLGAGTAAAMVAD